VLRAHVRECVPSTGPHSLNVFGDACVKGRTGTTRRRGGWRMEGKRRKVGRREGGGGGGPGEGSCLIRWVGPWVPLRVFRFGCATAQSRPTDVKKQNCSIRLVPNAAPSSHSHSFIHIGAQRAAAMRTKRGEGLTRHHTFYYIYHIQHTTQYVNCGCASESYDFLHMTHLLASGKVEVTADRFTISHGK
jgi:hypothetical protein